MIRNVPQDVADFLNINVVALTSGVNLFKSKLRASGTGIPEEAVFVSRGGGLPPGRFMGQTTEIESVIVNIAIRSSTNSGGETLIIAVREALRGADIPNLLDFVASESDPIDLGVDRDRLHLWSMGYVGVYEA